MKQIIENWHVSLENCAPTLILLAFKINHSKYKLSNTTTAVQLISVLITSATDTVAFSITVVLEMQY